MHRPTFNRVLIEPVDAPSSGGRVLVNTEHQPWRWCKILAVGPGAGRRIVNGIEVVYHDFKPGDILLYNTAHAVKVTVGTDVFTMIDDDKLFVFQDDAAAVIPE